MTSIFGRSIENYHTGKTIIEGDLEVIGDIEYKHENINSHTAEDVEIIHHDDTINTVFTNDGNLTNSSTIFCEKLDMRFTEQPNTQFSQDHTTNLIFQTTIQQYR